MTINKFDPQCFYHIYNRVIGYEKLFLSEKDYYYFKYKLKRFIKPVADIYAYCLMPTHFHLLIHTKNINNKEITHRKVYNNSLNNLFSSYVKSFNKAHNRHGKLFQQSYKNKLINSDEQLINTIHYIHRNPVHHSYVEECDLWEHSSFLDILDENDDIIDINKIIELFDGKEKHIKLTRELTTEYFKSLTFWEDLTKEDSQMVEG